jgi:hypothetical protein
MGAQRLGRSPKVQPEERRGEFGHQLFEGVSLVTETSAELTVQAARSAAPVQLMPMSA